MIEYFFLSKKKNVIDIGVSSYILQRKVERSRFFTLYFYFVYPFSSEYMCQKTYNGSVYPSLVPGPCEGVVVYFSDVYTQLPTICVGVEVVKSKVRRTQLQKHDTKISPRTYHQRNSTPPVVGILWIRTLSLKRTRQNTYTHFREKVGS